MIHHKCGQPDFRGWDLGQHKTDKASIMHCPQLPEDRRSVISALRFLSHLPCLPCLDGLPLKVQTRRNLCSLHFGDNTSKVTYKAVVFYLAVIIAGMIINFHRLDIYKAQHEKASRGIAIWDCWLGVKLQDQPRAKRGDAARQIPRMMVLEWPDKLLIGIFKNKTLSF